MFYNWINISQNCSTAFLASEILTCQSTNKNPTDRRLLHFCIANKEALEFPPINYSTIGYDFLFDTGIRNFDMSIYK